MGYLGTSAVSFQNCRLIIVKNGRRMMWGNYVQICGTLCATFGSIFTSWMMEWCWMVKFLKFIELRNNHKQPISPVPDASTHIHLFLTQYGSVHVNVWATTSVWATVCSSSGCGSFVWRIFQVFGGQLSSTSCVINPLWAKCSGELFDTATGNHIACSNGNYGR